MGKSATPLWKRRVGAEDIVQMDISCQHLVSSQYYNYLKYFIPQFCIFYVYYKDLIDKDQHENPIGPSVSQAFMGKWANPPDINQPEDTFDSPLNMTCIECNRVGQGSSHKLTVVCID